jgi:glyoxylase I family protein
VLRVPDNDDILPGNRKPVPHVYAPFPEDTTYFGDNGKQWMNHFRVANLDAMAAQLRAARITD